MLRTLAADAQCVEQPALAHLPGTLRSLLEESAALYGRATRLASSGPGGVTWH